MKFDTKSVLLGVFFSLTLIFGFGYTNITSDLRLYQLGNGGAIQW